MVCGSIPHVTRRWRHEHTLHVPRLWLKLNASVSAAHTTLQQQPKESNTLHELVVRKETIKRGRSTLSLIKPLKEPVIFLRKARKKPNRWSEICRGEVSAF